MCIKIFIKIFLLIWWCSSIIFVYYIMNKYLLSIFDITNRWSIMLPNLGYPIFNRTMMGIHFFFGIIVQLIGPIQFIEYLRKIHIHQWTGRVYIISAIITSICGISFIIINDTVGKLNMSISFMLYGICLYVSATMTWIHARRKEYRNHMYWAIRTFSLGIGSWLYRLLYYTAFACGYTFTRTEDFLRPLDMIFDWLFFVPNIIFAEIVIILIKKYIK